MPVAATLQGASSREWPPSGAHILLRDGNRRADHSRRKVQSVVFFNLLSNVMLAAQGQQTFLSFAMAI